MNSGWISGLRSVLTVAAAGLLATQALAEDGPWRLQRYKAATYPNVAAMPKAERSRAVMDYFGMCMLGAEGGNVRKFVMLPPGSAKARKLADYFVSDECMTPGELRFNQSLLRGSLYRALYIDEFKAGAAPMPADMIDYRADFGADPLDDVQVALRQFADCVVRAEPKAVRGMLLSVPGSAAESERFREVMPSLGPCMASGSQVKFSKPVLFGLVAESMYRLSKLGVASPAPAGAKTEAAK